MGLNFPDSLDAICNGLALGILGVIAVAVRAAFWGLRLAGTSVVVAAAVGGGAVGFAAAAFVVHKVLPHRASDVGMALATMSSAAAATLAAYAAAGAASWVTLRRAGPGSA